MRRLPWLAAAMIVALAAGCDKIEFKEFESAEGKFSVLMPGKPERKAQSMMGIKLVMYGVNVKNGAYAVAYADIPAGTPFNLPGAVQGVANSHGGTVLSDKDYAFEGSYGREFEIETTKPKGFVSGRVIMIDNRFYEIFAMGDKIRLADPEVQKYLGSFKRKR